MDPIYSSNMEDAAVRLDISVSDISLIAGETALVNFSFSSTVYDFSLSDVLLYSSSGTSAGVLSGFVITGSTTYQATFTPALNFEGSLYMYVPTGAYTLGGLDPGAEAYSPVISIDTKVPTATIRVADNDITYRESVDLVVTFSERIVGFDWSDLVGPTGSFSNATMSADGKIYTAEYYPGDGWSYVSSPATLSLPLGSYADLSGNAGTAAVSNAFLVDTIDENVTVTLSDTTLTGGESMRVSVAFATPVQSFNPDDVIWPSTFGSLSGWTNEYEDSGPAAGQILGVSAFLRPMPILKFSSTRSWCAARVRPISLSIQNRRSSNPSSSVMTI